jgi:ribonuclease HII
MREGLWDLEDSAYREGFAAVAGVDEAGRGPLAGDVYAAAVVLPRGAVIAGLDDSKRLAAGARERLFRDISERAEAYGVASASVREIEERNILGATYLAMNRALGALLSAPAVAEAVDAGRFLALIDGNRDAGIEYRSRTAVKGDSRSASIAAASILAKVSRDRYMDALAARYPGYGFERNRGYGTAEHYAALRALGATPEHRKLFLRKTH